LIQVSIFQRALQGSLRRTVDQLRVTAQWIDVSNGYQIWSERYDRQLVDIFAIQDEIVQSIAERIRGATKVALAAPLEPRQFTGNIQIYLSYFGYARGSDCLESALPTLAELWPRSARPVLTYPLPEVGQRT